MNSPKAAAVADIYPLPVGPCTSTLFPMFGVNFNRREFNYCAMSLWGRALDASPKICFHIFIPPGQRHPIPSIPLPPVVRTEWVFGLRSCMWGWIQYFNCNLLYGQCNIYMASQPRCPILPVPPWTGLNGDIGWGPPYKAEYIFSGAISCGQCTYIFHVSTKIAPTDCFSSGFFASAQKKKTQIKW